MALSSSKSSSSFACCKYDVFLSFRGEDTRNTFTSHLAAALRRNKLEIFIDDKLRRGDEISTALLNAIETSKISVIIFSKNYASSSWCLDELVKILECHKMNGQMVIPVFYHVDPSNVRKKTGSFGKAFVELAKRFKKMPEKVQKWRAVLTEASNLSGWDSMKIKPEATLKEEIVKDILKKLKDKSFSSDFKGLVGINPRIEELKSLLGVGFPDFRIVGIWGMGGIGKTTVARAVYNQLSSEFECKCFMASVRKASEEGGGLLHLRDQVLSHILAENVKIGTPDIPQNLKERLKQMKVFIVLDDVNRFGQLECLAGGLDRFGPGSRIIVTTRDKKVLDKYGLENICKVKEFNENEALQLFCNYAFRQKHCPKDLSVLSKRVIDYAKGNPLALKVLGSFFHGKSKSDWKDTLHNLKRISDPVIYDVLKISFDDLNWDVKNIFLDIACFFRGDDKDHVISVSDDSCLMRYGLGVLVEKSLITISNKKLEMHDLLQEMGEEIVREENEEPGKRSRSWDPKDVCQAPQKNKKKIASQPQLKIGVNDHFHAELTCLSRLRVVDHIRSKLTTSQIDIFRQTCLGHFLDIKTVHHQCILLHYVLLHEIHTDGNNNEMWFLVAGKAIRFSRIEFGLITGLNCGHFPIVDVSESTRLRDAFFGGQTIITLDDIEMVFDELDFSIIPDLDAVRLSLFYMLERVLFGRGGKHHVDQWLLNILEDLEQFNRYPWGSVVFEYTFQSMRQAIPSQFIMYKKEVPKLEAIGKKFKAKYNLFGFPIAFQVWLYESILDLQNKFVKKINNEIPRILRWKTSKGPIGKKTIDAHIFSSSTLPHVRTTLKPNLIESWRPYVLRLFDIIKPHGSYGGYLFSKAPAAITDQSMQICFSINDDVAQSSHFVAVPPPHYSSAPSLCYFSSPPQYYSSTPPMQYSPVPSSHYSLTASKHYLPIPSSHHSPTPPSHYYALPPRHCFPILSPHYSPLPLPHHSHTLSSQYSQTLHPQTSTYDEFRVDMLSHFDTLAVSVQQMERQLRHDSRSLQEDVLRIEHKIDSVEANFSQMAIDLREWMHESKSPPSNAQIAADVDIN